MTNRRQPIQTEFPQEALDAVAVGLVAALTNTPVYVVQARLEKLRAEGKWPRPKVAAPTQAVASPVVAPAPVRRNKSRKGVPA